MSGMPWFRLYARAIDDDRIRLLAFEDRWHFIAILCLKCDGLLDDDADDDLRMRRIAVKLGLTARETEEVKRRLCEVGLIDEAFQPLKWEKLQFRSDNSKERVRRYREKQKKQATKKVKRPCNVTVTAQDTDTDTDIRTPKGVCAEAGASAPDPENDFSIDDFVESWNEAADECGLPKIRKMTESRKRAFKVRKREYPNASDWQDAFDTLRKNKWMHGDNQKGWRADVDFFLQAKSFTRLVEGAYGKADS